MIACLLAKPEGTFAEENGVSGNRASETLHGVRDKKFLVKTTPCTVRVKKMLTVNLLVAQ